MIYKPSYLEYVSMIKHVGYFIYFVFVLCYSYVGGYDTTVCSDNSHRVYTQRQMTLRSQMTTS